jgi:uncharacterized protein
MNKPAPKEPSMDEILSSIRQIIADDDSISTPRRPAAAEPVQDESPVPMRVVASEAESAPLALSAEQIVDQPAAAAEAADFSAFMEQETGEGETVSEALQADFVDPDDIAFEPDPEPEPPPPPRPTPLRPAAPPASPPLRQQERPRPTPAQAAPMPDPRLSEDIAEELLAPATDAVVRANLSRLANLGLGAPGITIEAMVREMLRPMLKEWLDENLPTVVERMVEKEIARISRGVQ